MAIRGLVNNVYITWYVECIGGGMTFKTVFAAFVLLVVGVPTLSDAQMAYVSPIPRELKVRLFSIELQKMLEIAIEFPDDLESHVLMDAYWRLHNEAWTSEGHMIAPDDILVRLRWAVAAMVGTIQDYEARLAVRAQSESLKECAARAASARNQLSEVVKDTVYREVHWKTGRW